MSSPFHSKYGYNICANYSVWKYDIQDTSTSMLEIDMPGVGANDVSLLLDNGCLVVRGRTAFRDRVWSYEWEGYVGSSIPVCS